MHNFAAAKIIQTFAVYLDEKNRERNPDVVDAVEHIHEIAEYLAAERASEIYGEDE